MLIDSSRPPDWRWQRAVRLADGPTAGGARPDGLTRRTVSFLKARRLARTNSERARLDEKCATIAMARDIRFGRPDGRRDIIEMRLLAGFPANMIAEHNGLDPVVVWAYEALFFDVADRLNAPDFVASQVIGLSHSDPDSPVTPRAVMLWLAWIGGPVVADALLLPGKSCKEPDSGEQVNDFLQSMAEAAITWSATVAPWLSRLNPEQLRQFVRTESARVLALRAELPGDAGYRAYLDNVKSFLGQIELSLGQRGIPDEKRKYCDGPVEPRADDWMAINRGEPVPELEARIAAASMRPL